jgi:hypothetical protein
MLWEFCGCSAALYAVKQTENVEEGWETGQLVGKARARAGGVTTFREQYRFSAESPAPGDAVQR